MTTRTPEPSEPSRGAPSDPSYTVLFDTCVASDNTGDEIIMDAVQKQLSKSLDSTFFVRLPTHDTFGKVGRNWIKQAKMCIVGGTNLLTSDYRNYHQWQFSLSDVFRLQQKVLLMGTGWWQYQPDPGWMTKQIYRKILSLDSSLCHSVRDSYTEAKLRAMGISNVLNTACPTMWNLTPEHCAKIPVSPGQRAVVTLTDYNPNPESDKFLVEQIRKSYGNLVVWPQGVGDFLYFQKLGIQEIASPGLASLDALLSEPGTDFIGTRLHAGIRALQHGRRSIIIAVDNRAREISNDTDLRVVDRNDREAIEKIIPSSFEFKIKLPQHNIDAWKRSLREWHARNGIPGGASIAENGA